MLVVEVVLPGLLRVVLAVCSTGSAATVAEEVASFLSIIGIFSLIVSVPVFLL